MPEQYVQEQKRIDNDREQRRELDRRSRTCEQRLQELQCLLQRMGLIADDRPDTSANGDGVARRGGEAAKA